MFLVFALFTSLLAGIQANGLVLADTKFYSPEFSGNLMTTTPESNITSSGTLPLNFTIEYGATVVIWEFSGVISYSIDGGPITKLSTNSLSQFGDGMNVSVNTNEIVNISNLTNGKHNLNIFDKGWYTSFIDQYSEKSFNVSFSPIYFSVYNVPSPNILVYSPQNRSYDFKNIASGSIQLNVTVDKPTSWIGYSINNQANATIVENTTLTGLSVGAHSLVVFANDTIGNMANSQIVNFSIVKAVNSFPFGFGNSLLIPIITIGFVVVAFASILLLRRHQKSTNLKLIETKISSIIAHITDLRKN
jgi:hypothetical protein